MTTETMPDPQSITADRIVDARGSACPGPLLEAKKGIGSVSIGQVLEIWSSRSGHEDGYRGLVGEGGSHLPWGPARRRVRARVRAPAEVGRIPHRRGVPQMIQTPMSAPATYPARMLVIATLLCSYPGIDATGQAHMEYPPNTFVIPTPDPVMFPESFYLYCFEHGIDAVLIASCGTDSPYEGSYEQLAERVRRVYGLMKERRHRHPASQAHRHLQRLHEGIRQGDRRHGGRPGRAGPGTGPAGGVLMTARPWQPRRWNATCWWSAPVSPACRRPWTWPTGATASSWWSASPASAAR